MKLSCMFIAAAAAVAPPQISLDLAQPIQSCANIKDIGQACGDKEDYKGHQDVAGVTRQDFVERCPANLANKKGDCAFPSAKAFDSFDKQVPVTTKIWLVDEEGVTKNEVVEKVAFNKRATYLFKYDALDKAGNKAEQVVFVLLVDDRKKPAINPCQGLNLGVIEAASDWKLCQDYAADNIDKGVGPSLRYTVTNVATKAVLFNQEKFADVKINTNLVGKYLVKVTAEDNAKMYGRGGLSNVVTIEKAFEITDTSKPIITIMGDEPAESECSTTYKDTGVSIYDKLDTAALKKTIKASVKSTVQSKKVGRYTVTYNANDFAGNKAQTKVRRVVISDKTKPKIWLKGPAKQVHYSQDKFVEHGTGVSDSCDKTLRAVTSKWITFPKGVKKWTDKVEGTYVKEYTVKDASLNTKTVRRTYVMVDNKIPIITVVGKDSLTYEASSTKTYVDSGATCSDYVDGVLDNAVGKYYGKAGKVNLSKPNTYTVTYNCKDLSQNTAVKMTRTIVVKDTTCPVVTLKGKQNVELEAGFQYKDAGASASDTLDGVLKVTTDGDTVNTKNAFFARRSCAEIKSKFAAANDGYYYITTFLKTKKTFDRVKVWCDMKESKTFYPVKKGKRVIPYNKVDGTCADFGMRMPEAKYLSKGAKAHFAAEYFPKKGETSNEYLCATRYGDNISKPNHGVTDKNLAKSTLNTKHNQIMHAEPGKYIINFHTKDKAGNTECKNIKRTVIVRDTLPPIIKLKMGKVLYQKSQGGQKGINGVINNPK